MKIEPGQGADSGTGRGIMGTDAPLSALRF